MPVDDPNTHTASIEVAAPAREVFEFMADGLRQTHWALGSADRRHLGDNLFVGESKFDGSELYVEINSYPELLLVDYSNGSAPDDLSPEVEVRVKPGSLFGRGDEVSVVIMTHFRRAGIDAEEWRLIYHLWKTEVHLIKGAIERGL
jgi:hypothetical protein